MINVTEETFPTILASKRFALFAFGAKWCAPCKSLAVILELICDPSLVIGIIDVEECPGITDSRRISNLPTLLLYKDGVVMASRSGSVTALVLKEWLEQHGALTCSLSLNPDNFVYPTMNDSLKYCIKALQVACHNQAKAGGWWNNIETGEPIQRNVGELLMLIVSEISEAMEGHRKGKNDDHLTHRPMIEVELADAVIRICDLAGGLNLDLAGALVEKLQYNAKRADHKAEARRAVGGKKY